MKFIVKDVPPDNIMRAALVVADRSYGTGEASPPSAVALATGLGEQQSANALIMAAEIRLVEADGRASYRYIGDPALRHSPKSGIAQFFRQAAQSYPPFLLFLGYLARGFEEVEAARHTSAAFTIGLEAKRLHRVFKGWARYAEVMAEDGSLDFKPKDVLDLGFLARLSDALRDEIATKTFVMEEIGHALWAQLHRDGIDVDAFSRALTKQRKEPKDALREVGAVVEAYLASLSAQVGGPQSQIGTISDFLSGKDQRLILRTHRNLGHGIGGLRNAADHGADPDTGRDWSISSEAALVGSLAGLLLVRSIAQFRSAKTQHV